MQHHLNSNIAIVYVRISLNININIKMTWIGLSGPTKKIGNILFINIFSDLGRHVLTTIDHEFFPKMLIYSVYLPFTKPSVLVNEGRNQSPKYRKYSRSTNYQYLTKCLRIMSLNQENIWLMSYITWNQPSSWEFEACDFLKYSSILW